MACRLQPVRPFRSPGGCRAEWFPIPGNAGTILFFGKGIEKGLEQDLGKFGRGNRGGGKGRKWGIAGRI